MRPKQDFCLKGVSVRAFAAEAGEHTQFVRHWGEPSSQCCFCARRTKFWRTFLKVVHHDSVLLSLLHEDWACLPFFGVVVVLFVEGEKEPLVVRRRHCARSEMFRSGTRGTMSEGLVLEVEEDGTGSS